MVFQFYLSANIVPVYDLRPGMEAKLRIAVLADVLLSFADIMRRFRQMLRLGFSCFVNGIFMHILQEAVFKNGVISRENSGFCKKISLTMMRFAVGSLGY